MFLQNTKPNECCADAANHTPIFVYIDGHLGFTQFCNKCNYVFLTETQFAIYEDGEKSGKPVNIFEDLGSISPTINILRKKVKYIVFPKGDSDEALITLLGVEELKLRQ